MARRELEDPAELAALRDALAAAGGPGQELERRFRDSVIAGGEAAWHALGPLCLGSLFEGSMEARQRRRLGAHYTSERDMMKLLGALFLDELGERLGAALGDGTPRRGERLREFVAGLRRLRILDPACGCGNFLILAYRELRRLETAALVGLRATGVLVAELVALACVGVDQVFGLEIVEASVRVAEVGLWLVHQQCERELAGALGEELRRPGATPTLRVANALALRWSELLAPDEHVIVLGNPPFVGKHWQTAAQKRDMRAVFAGAGNAGDLDYVACWFVAAAEYVQGTRARCAFVATSSITQGEQVPLLWRLLFERYALKIHFAHRPFKWASEAREEAHVYVVIIGFGAFDRGAKRLFDDDVEAGVEVANISPYLMVGPDRHVAKARAALTAGVPEMRCGSKPSDGGHLIFTDAERRAFLGVEPGAGPLFRRYCGSEEFIHGGMRWCLWLKDVDPAVIGGLPEVRARVERVRAFRRGSTAAPTRAAAGRPAEFFHLAQPERAYIVVPEVSSERRRYIPIGYLEAEVVASNKLYIVAEPALWVFGVLASAMHMAWVRVVCGRLKSDYQYSATMVYNTFPWPREAAAGERAAVEEAAKGVLEARREFVGRTLAELYDPAGMPVALARAHAALDRAVDDCYRPEGFAGEAARFEHALWRYQGLVAENGVRRGA